MSFLSVITHFFSLKSEMHNLAFMIYTTIYVEGIWLQLTILRNFADENQIEF